MYKPLHIYPSLQHYFAQLTNLCTTLHKLATNLQTLAQFYTTLHKLTTLYTRLNCTRFTNLYKASQNLTIFTTYTQHKLYEDLTKTCTQLYKQTNKHYTTLPYSTTIKSSTTCSKPNKNSTHI